MEITIDQEARAEVLHEYRLTRTYRPTLSKVEAMHATRDWFARLVANWAIDQGDVNERFLARYAAALEYERKLVDALIVSNLRNAERYAQAAA